MRRRIFFFAVIVFLTGSAFEWIDEVASSVKNVENFQVEFLESHTVMNDHGATAATPVTKKNVNFWWEAVAGCAAARPTPAGTRWWFTCTTLNSMRNLIFEISAYDNLPRE